MKKKLIIWGGWWGKDMPLSIDNINSHASITAYFLTKHLAEFYDIVNIYNFYSAERILDEKDAIAALSTFQSGFTRLSEVGENNKFKNIRKNFRGKLCSIVDDVYRLNYNEDILFTVRPLQPGAASLIKRLFNKGIVIERCGWPADPDICFPEVVGEDQINIFVDHSWYRGGLDCSRLYFNTFKCIIRDCPNFYFNVYRQNNDGVVKWNLDGEFKEPRYLRSNKVPYLDILKYYRKCHIFCVTHPESAGLAAIEAAMCGAKLYVPSFFGRSFISKGLLKDGINYKTVKMNKKSIISALREDIKNGFDRYALHNSLLKTNTWKVAAANIHRALSERT